MECLQYQDVHTSFVCRVLVDDAMLCNTTFWCLWRSSFGKFINPLKKCELCLTCMQFCVVKVLQSSAAVIIEPAGCNLCSLDVARVHENANKLWNIMDMRFHYIYVNRNFLNYSRLSTVQVNDHLVDSRNQQWIYVSDTVTWVSFLWL